MWEHEGEESILLQKQENGYASPTKHQSQLEKKKLRSSEDNPVEIEKGNQIRDNLPIILVPDQSLFLCLFFLIYTSFKI